MMVGRWVSFWDCLSLGAMLNFRGACSASLKTPSFGVANSCFCLQLYFMDFNFWVGGFKYFFQPYLQMGWNHHLVNFSSLHLQVAAAEVELDLRSGLPRHQTNGGGNGDQKPKRGICLRKDPGCCKLGDFCLDFEAFCWVFIVSVCFSFGLKQWDFNMVRKLSSILWLFGLVVTRTEWGPKRPINHWVIWSHTFWAALVKSWVFLCVEVCFLAQDHLKKPTLSCLIRKLLHSPNQQNHCGHP